MPQVTHVEWPAALSPSVAVRYLWSHGGPQWITASLVIAVGAP